MTENIDPEIGNRIIEQALEMWINPEIKRRRDAGLLSDDFTLSTAQVIMNFDAPTQVRLNEDVKAIVRGSFSRPVAEGEPISLSEMDKIVAIELTDRDPNAGHLTMLFHKGSWVIAFDFRYNAAYSLEHLEAAREFLDAATSSLERGHLRACIDNLFSATELMAKGLLIMHDEVVFKATKTHGVIHGRYNKWGSYGNVNHRFTELLNRLEKLRNPARYLRGNWNLSAEEVRNMLSTAEDMFVDLKAHIPERKW